MDSTRLETQPLHHARSTMASDRNITICSSGDTYKGQSKTQSLSSINILRSTPQDLLDARQRNNQNIKRSNTNQSSDAYTAHRTRPRNQDIKTGYTISSGQACYHSVDQKTRNLHHHIRLTAET